jgi:hypothetical protein
MPVRALSIAFLLAGMMVLSGCARVAEVITPEPEMVSIEPTVGAPGAPVIGELPDNVPDGLPLWPGATVIEGVSSEQGFQLVLMASGAFEDVFKGMAKGFEDAGWEIAQEDMGEDAAGIAVLTVASPVAQGLVTMTLEDTSTVSVTYILAVE